MQNLNESAPRVNARSNEISVGPSRAGNDRAQLDQRINRVRHERNFVQIDNATAQDARLSWAARGLLLYLLSLPVTWQVRVSHLQAQGDAGRDGVRALLRELQSFGYLSGFSRERERGEAGRLEAREIVVYESPSLNPFFLEKTPETAEASLATPPETPSPALAEPAQAEPSAYKEHSRQKTHEQKTHTQTRAPRAGVGVAGRPGSKFSLAECQRYAEHLHDTGQGITNPAGFARTIHRSGECDEQIAQFLNPPIEAPPVAADRPQLAPAAPDCPLCLGTGKEHVRDGSGRISGVKPTPCQCRTVQSQQAAPDRPQQAVQGAA